MKKIFTIGLISLCLLIVIINTNLVHGLFINERMIDVTICNNNNIITLNNQLVNLELEIATISVYRIHDEDDDLIVYHLSHSRAHIIFREESLNFEKLHLQVIIWQAAILTFRQDRINQEFILVVQTDRLNFNFNTLIQRMR